MVARILHRLVPIAGVAAVLVALVASGTSSATTRGTTGATQSLTVVGAAATWPQLNPVTDPEGPADYLMLNAIYGQLFEQGTNHTLIPDLATGYKFSDNNTLVTISLRSGVTFQDGSPFTAQAVQQNIENALNPANACLCLFDWSDVKSVTTAGTDTVQLHLATPFPPIIEAFIGEAPNWTPSPTALAKAGAGAFDQHPVGAGPFEVESNSESSQLVLKRYPGYWQSGHPYLQSLKFVSTATDETAYEALESGSAQMTQLASVALIHQARGQFHVSTIPGTGVSLLNFNTKTPPFNNILAREAVTYATNEQQILEKIDSGYGTITESPTGPGGRFYEPKVPGYHSYDLEKARALVKQLGGLSATLMTGNTPEQVVLATALQEQWKLAGITVNLEPLAFAAEVENLMHHTWQVTAGEAGGPDPVVGVESLANNLGCQGAFSAVCDPVLDGLIQQLRTNPDQSARAKVFREAAARIADQAYAVYGVVTPWNVVTSVPVTGMTLVSGEDGPIVNWEDVKVG
jgi:peptide/nickel transport system substrate-binding protein